MSEDKPCPFCGTPPFSDGSGGLYCDNPLCPMKFVDSFSTAAWNTRTPPIREEGKVAAVAPKMIWVCDSGIWFSDDQGEPQEYEPYHHASTLSALQEQNRALEVEVERLRALVPHPDETDLEHILREANRGVRIEDIARRRGITRERARLKLAKAREQLGGMTPAEKQRLREALEEIAEMRPHHAGQTPNEYHMQQIAIAATKQVGGE